MIESICLSGKGEFNRVYRFAYLDDGEIATRPREKKKKHHLHSTNYRIVVVVAVKEKKKVYIIDQREIDLNFNRKLIKITQKVFCVCKHSIEKQKSQSEKLIKFTSPRLRGL